MNRLSKRGAFGMNPWTGKAQNMHEWLEHLKNNQEIMRNVTHWKVIPPREAKVMPLPAELHPELKKALLEKGMTQLYTHQATAFQASNDGKHVVTVTPTASGKTL